MRPRENVARAIIPSGARALSSLCVPAPSVPARRAALTPSRCVAEKERKKRKGKKKKRLFQVSLDDELNRDDF